MKSKKVRILSAALLISVMGIGSVSLTSCGEKENVHWIASEDSTSSKIDLSLPDSLIVRADDTKYFAPYIVDQADDGSYSFISSGGDTLLESGKEAKLLAYWVPEDYNLFVSVQDSNGKAVSGIVLADGSVIAPSVTNKTEYVITLSAVSEGEVLGTDGESHHKVVKQKLNLTVIPSGSIAANGSFYYPSLSEEERTDITACLEKYAMSHGLTGVKYTANGGYALYNSRVSTPLLDADNYLSDYGFGTAQYGKINSAMETESTEAYQWYYHSLLSPSNDLGTVWYINSDKAAVSTQYSYMASSLYGYSLNEDYSAREAQLVLAREDPEPLEVDENGLCKKWKVKVWVGGDADDDAKGVKKGLSFRSATNSAYDKKDITLEDYLTPVKLMATGSIATYRGSEAAESTQSKTKLVGFSDYYNSTLEATDIDDDATFCSKVGVSIDHSDNSITYEFEGGFDEGFAKYYIDQLWCNPMNEDFVREIGDGDIIKGAQQYGTSPEGETPASTSLSVGPYYLEKYQTGVEIAYKKNEEWPLKYDNHGREMYQIAGFHFKVDSALTNDEEESMKMFEGGYTDSVSLSTDEQYNKYSTDPRLRKTLPDGTFGTTFNRMDNALWQYYFGEGGLWYDAIGNDGSLTEGKEVVPIVSNDNYFKALNLGYDRAAYDEVKHQGGIYYDYFMPGQTVNPTTPTYYNDTEQHKQVVEDLYGDSFDDPANSPVEAVSYMQDGIVEELDAGHYDLGTVEEPTDLGFDTSILNSSYYQNLVNYMTEYWGKVFSNAVTSYRGSDGTNPLVDDSGNALVKFEITKNEYSYDGTGQNNLLYGIWSGYSTSQSVFSISGNSSDSIDYLDILSCNKCGGFELSFAVDTSIPSGIIEYDDKYWSFESLWWACNGGAILDEDGVYTGSVEQ